MAQGSRKRRRPAAERDAEARAGLQPLAEGERPRWVTIAAVVAAALAAANVGALLAGAEFLGEDESSARQATIVTTVLLLAAAAGMWRSRYWAVLGFQVMLLFQILALFAAVLRVEKWWVGVIVGLALAGFCTLFYKLIRAMARIQMPERTRP